MKSRSTCAGCSERPAIASYSAIMSFTIALTSSPSASVRNDGGLAAGNPAIAGTGVASTATQVHETVLSCVTSPRLKPHTLGGLSAVVPPAAPACWMLPLLSTITAYGAIVAFGDHAGLGIARRRPDRHRGALRLRAGELELPGDGDLEV